MSRFRSGGVRQAIKQLSDLRRRFDDQATAEKRALLAALSDREIRDPRLLRRLHGVLCYIRAFPDNAIVMQLSERCLNSFEQRVAELSVRHRQTLEDSGIVGTNLYYEFSYEVFRWLIRRHAGDVRIDWYSYHNADVLDDILSLTVLPAEAEWFDSGKIDTRAWVRLAMGSQAITDALWMFRQVQVVLPRDDLRAVLYNSAAVPLTWKVPGRSSITGNRLPSDQRARRRRHLRSAPRQPVPEIRRPLRSLRRASVAEARGLIDVAVAALAVRHREVHAMNHANAQEVYVADVGSGTQIVVLGVQPQQRLSLDGNYGYLLLSRGMPVGYGGVSPLFSQANTGINIFEEFRGSEAAWLLIQTLRTLHVLFGVTCFVANPYQAGRDNPEALRSGAFWFYYRLGFRPVEPTIARLARTEWARLRRRPGRRSDVAMLRKLGSVDLRLRLPGNRAEEFFPEHYLERCAAGATEVIARESLARRSQVATRLAARVADWLGARQRSTWPAGQRRAFSQMAPVVSLIPEVQEWSRGQRLSLVRLMRAKGDRRELRYIRLLRQHTLFRKALKKYCSRRNKA